MVISFLGFALADALLIFLIIALGDVLLRRMIAATLWRRLLIAIPALIPGFFILLAKVGQMEAAIATILAVPLVLLAMWFLDRHAAG